MVASAAMSYAVGTEDSGFSNLAVEGILILLLLVLTREGIIIHPSSDSSWVARHT